MKSRSGRESASEMMDKLGEGLKVRDRGSQRPQEWGMESLGDESIVRSRRREQLGVAV